MLLTALAAAFLSATPASIPSTTPVPGDHGKIAWFKGSYEAALAKAKAENKLIFIDFWTDWCVWCKRLDKDTFSDESVAAEMKDVICLSIDAESETGAPIAKGFALRGYPALLVLGSDGKVEDNIGGYLKPDQFKDAIRRVRSGEGTVSGLRKKVAAEPSNVVLRFQLASKLESIGDVDGHAAELAEIKKIDPDGKSLPLRRQALMAIAQNINETYEKTREVDQKPLLDFLAEEKHPEVLFEGWGFVGNINFYLSRLAEARGQTEETNRLRAVQRNALRTAWAHVPEASLVTFGNTLAFAYFEERRVLSDEDKAFALEVARKVNEAAKDNVNAIDTYACCLAMNGKKDEALAQIRRCIELEPDKAQWKERLKELGG